MPSPETEFNGEDPDLLLSRPGDTSSGKDRQDSPASVKASRRRQWIGTFLGLLIAIPVVLTLASALTSPPHVKSVPTGRLIYLEADEPSDHTALLRGLRVMVPDGASHQLLHETEPQDRDAGSREWISQPTASPDGRWLAFEKQIITLQEEEQSIDNQLWVLPLTGPNPKPRLLLDLTKQKLKQFIGLAWTLDSASVVFVNDAAAYTVHVPEGHFSQMPLTIRLGAKAPPTMSITRDPVMLPTDPDSIRYEYSEDDKQRLLNAYHPDVFGPSSMASLVDSDGHQAHLQTSEMASPLKPQTTQATRLLSAKWGWSIFGGRHITALKWSPDGKYLGYSVSKPPLEDELFYIDLASGKCFQLPVRTGRAGWDWAR